MNNREIHEALPAAMRAAVDEFGVHLARIDNRSAHTVRAYVGDVVSLLDHAASEGCAEPADLDITVLRAGWRGAWPAARRGPRRHGGPPRRARSPRGRTAPGCRRPTPALSWPARAGTATCRRS
jgi:integrase/recombinase XerC